MVLVVNNPQCQNKALCLRGSAVYSADDRRTEMFWKSLCVFVLLRTRASWTWWESGQFYSSTSSSLKLLFSVKSNHELLWQVQIKQRTTLCSGTWIFAFMVSCWLYLLLLRYIITLHYWCGNKDAKISEPQLTVIFFTDFP